MLSPETYRRGFSNDKQLLSFAISIMTKKLDFLDISVRKKNTYIKKRKEYIISGVGEKASKQMVNMYSDVGFYMCLGHVQKQCFNKKVLK